MKTWEGEEPAVHSARDGLQFDHVHGLSHVDRGWQTSQSSTHKFCYFLYREHLKKLVKDGGEGVQ